MRVTVRADGSRSEELWRWLATPALWPRWAPHIRRTSTSAAVPTQAVSPGDIVFIEGVGPTRVTAKITRVDHPHRWDFRVDLPLGYHVEASHEVLRGPVAVSVGMTLHGAVPGPVGRAMLTLYRPVAMLALRRLVALTRDGRA